MAWASVLRVQELLPEHLPVALVSVLRELPREPEHPEHVPVQRPVDSVLPVAWV